MKSDTLKFVLVFLVGTAVTLLALLYVRSPDGSLSPGKLLSYVVGGQSSKLMAIKRESERKAIINNLRQLASAADQYFLEMGVTEVAVQDLVGGDKFIRELEPVAGESYQGFIISQGTALTVTDSRGEVYQLDF